MAQIQDANIRAYLSDICSTWPRIMSGGFSVPFSALAISYPAGSIPQCSFVILAVCSLLIAPYLAWADQQRKIIKLETDIHFLSSQGIDPDIKADRALAYIETRTWDYSFNEFMGLKDGNKGTPFVEFRQAALYGKFKVWGKTGRYEPHSPIEKEYWNNWKVEVLSCVDGECKTEVPSGTSRVDIRYDLMVRKAEIEKIWPPKK